MLKGIVTKGIYMFFLEPEHDLRDKTAKDVTLCPCFDTVHLQLYR